MLAAQIELMRPDIVAYSAGFQPIRRGETSSQTREDYTGENTSKLQRILTILTKFSQEEKQKISTRIETLLLQEDISEEMKKQLQIFRIAIKLSLGS